MAQKQKHSARDTLFVPAGDLLILQDTAYVFPNDTVILLQKGMKANVRKNPKAKTDAFYDSLKSKSGNTRVTRELYSLLIREEKDQKSDTVNLLGRSNAYFQPFAGKTITKIRFKKVLILEGSVSDTSRTAQTRIAKSLDKSHRNTQNAILRATLFFKEGDQLDPDELADSERTLRQLNFIRDVRIYISPNEEQNDEVTVIVVTQDVFPIGISGSFSSFKDFRVELYNRNILGSGYEFRTMVQFNQSKDQSVGYGFRLSQPNLFGRFVQMDVEFLDSWDENKVRLYIDRSFITPSIRWGGGFTSTYFWDTKNFFVSNDPENTYKDSLHNRTVLDGWLGHSFILNKKRRNNLIFALRGFWDRFSERPPVSLDENLIFLNTKGYLSAVTLTLNSDFYRTNKVFGFGRTEDMATGYRVGVTFGRLWTDVDIYPYSAMLAAGSQYFKKIGYIQLSTEFGGIRERAFETAGLLNVRLFYFTPLLKLSRWDFRQFLEVNVQKSIELTNLVSARRYITNSPGSEDFLGNQIWGINLESQYYTPWDFYGFKFNIYHFFDVAGRKLNQDTGVNKDVYLGIGAGIRILNESLVFPAVDLSVTYMPLGPSSNFGFGLGFTDPRSLDLGIVGKPEFISF